MTEIPRIPPDGSFELNLRTRHLEQLHQVQIPVTRIPGPP